MLTSVLRRTVAISGLLIVLAVFFGSPVIAANQIGVLQQQVDTLEARVNALEAHARPFIPGRS